MKNISQIDKNFLIKTDINKDNIKFYNAEELPFKVYGVFKEDGMYRRMPEKVASSVSEGVRYLHANTAGGRVRFKTNSSYIAIHTDMDSMGRMSNFALTGSRGLDLYVENTYTKTFVPPYDEETGFEGIAEFESKELREVTINLPLYCNVIDLYIGLEKDAVIEEASPYKNDKPIVFYGSSITQGGCASRPGMSYQSILSRQFNYDFVNLGFSGSARAEDEMIEYVKKLDMYAFVYDYDHNAPNEKYLADTHEKMFKEVRRENPYLPIIIMSRPKYNLTESEKNRRAIIETTYKNAVLQGDKNVYFIGGDMLTKLCKDNGTVDGCHPTDFGFVSMANALADVIINNNI